MLFNCNFFWALLWYRYWKYMKISPHMSIKAFEWHQTHLSGPFLLLNEIIKVLFVIPSSCTTYHGFLSLSSGQKETIVRGRGVLCIWSTCASHFSPVELFGPYGLYSNRHINSIFNLRLKAVFIHSVMSKYLWPHEL